MKADAKPVLCYAAESSTVIFNWEDNSSKILYIEVFYTNLNYSYSPVHFSVALGLLLSFLDRIG